MCCRSELDIDAEMQRGLLPGVLALASKFVPTVKAVVRRTITTLWEALQVTFSPAACAEAPLWSPMLAHLDLPEAQ